MKYIRTTKGIWEIEKLTKQDYEWLQKGENKQADTIEELCDEFVEIYGEHKELVDLSRVTYYTKITLGEYYLNRIANSKALGNLIDNKDKDIKLYGAIWTEWGLKYVAKMNDQGELELL